MITFYIYYHLYYLLVFHFLGGISSILFSFFNNDDDTRIIYDADKGDDSRIMMLIIARRGRMGIMDIWVSHTALCSVMIDANDDNDDKLDPTDWRLNYI